MGAAATIVDVTVVVLLVACVIVVVVPVAGVVTGTVAIPPAHAERPFPRRPAALDAS